MTEEIGKIADDKKEEYDRAHERDANVVNRSFEDIERVEQYNGCVVELANRAGVLK